MFGGLIIVISKEITVKVCHANYKYYEDKGYRIKKDIDKQGRPTTPDQYIVIKWEDAPRCCQEEIELKCDVCGSIFRRKIMSYYSSHKNNDIDACTKKCQAEKSKITKIEKYGTYNPDLIAKQTGAQSGRSKKYNIDDIAKLCSDKGYVLLRDKIEDINQTTTLSKISAKCLEHGVEFEVSVESLSRQGVVHCPVCVSNKLSEMNRKCSIDDAAEICIEKNYTLLTKSINNCDDRVLYICNLHQDYGPQSTSLYGLKKYENNCQLCKVPRQENHWHWAGGISSERENIKSGYEYQQWVKSVFKRDDYTCQCCGKRGVPLEAHHIYNFSDYPDLRTNIDNGITLCHDCHSTSIPTSFHGIYTQFHNTPDQLQQYLDENRPIHGLDKISLYEITGAESHFYDSFLIA